MEVALQLQVLLLVLHVLDCLELFLELVQFVGNPILDLRVIIHAKLRFLFAHHLHRLDNLHLHLIKLILQVTNHLVLLVIRLDQLVQLVAVGLLCHIQLLDEGHQLLLDDQAQLLLALLGLLDALVYELVEVGDSLVYLKVVVLETAKCFQGLHQFV